MKSSKNRINNEHKRKKDFKIVVLGGGGVGKSALTIQYIKSQFVYDYDPTIEDSYRKQCIIDDITARMDILDTSGQEEFRDLKEQYIRLGEGFLIVYSIVDRNSLFEVVKCRNSILRVKEKEDFPIVVVGNKNDLEQDRLIQLEEGQELVDSFHSKLCVPLETSAKTRQNVDLAFITLVRLIREYKRNEKPQSSPRKHLKCSIQ